MESKRAPRHATHGRRAEPDHSGSLREGLASLKEEAGHRAGALVERARGGGQRFLKGRKLGAASELSHVTAAMRRAADELYDHGSGLAEYVDTSAEYVGLAAQYLQTRELDELVEDAQALARRQPMLFLGGMFVAGLAAARLVKATAPPPPASSSPRPRRPSRSRDQRNGR
jgi:hypothetical protein